jgi:3',5'-cyclic AMP phosphodiesterase CpdA
MSKKTRIAVVSIVRMYGFPARLSRRKSLSVVFILLICCSLFTIAEAQSFRAVVFGDVHCHADSQANAPFSRIMELARTKSPDIYLSPGDLVGNGAVEEEWQVFFSILGEERGYFYTAIGNHDTWKDDGPATIARYFPTQERDYFTLRYQGAYFIFLNTQSISFYDGQIAFLEAELNNASGKGPVIVILHKPLFSTDMRYKNYRIPRITLSRLFARYGVDLVISGHRHYYERQKAVAGMHYLVSGGGSKVNSSQPAPDYVEKIAFINHFLIIERNNDSLWVKAIDLNDVVLDQFSLNWQENDRKENLSYSGHLQILGKMLSDEMRNLLYGLGLRTMKRQQKYK